MTQERVPDLVFGGSIPEVYDGILVPLIFQPYADDITSRVMQLSPGPLLEVAAGTGAVTRTMADRLPDAVSITATDLNQPMIDHATRVGTSRPVEWRQADVMDLPFADSSFDMVVCQFGVMFFPDRPAAFAEMRRVLRPGGVLLFNVWNSLADNDFPRIISEAVAELFPDNPATFFARVPHGYCDEDLIQSDLAGGGFSKPATIDIVDARSHAATARIAAVAFCQGTPLRNEIVARDPARLDEATDHAATAIEEHYGPTDIDGKISARVVTVTAA